MAAETSQNASDAAADDESIPRSADGRPIIRRHDVGPVTIELSERVDDRDDTDDA